MDHLAFMKKSWGFVEKILAGEKTIESRWYLSRYAPWDRIAKGDTVYFKNSGEPVSVKADVAQVLQFENLTPRRVKELLDEYGARIGIEKKDAADFFTMFKDKRYCILIFLKDPRAIIPFDVKKSGFGAMASWMSLTDIRKVSYNAHHGEKISRRHR